MGRFTWNAIALAVTLMAALSVSSRMQFDVARLSAVSWLALLASVVGLVLVVLKVAVPTLTWVRVPRGGPWRVLAAVGAFALAVSALTVVQSVGDHWFSLIAALPAWAVASFIVGDLLRKGSTGPASPR